MVTSTITAAWMPLGVTSVRSTPRQSIRVSMPGVRAGSLYSRATQSSRSWLVKTPEHSTRTRSDAASMVYVAGKSCFLRFGEITRQRSEDALRWCRCRAIVGGELPSIAIVGEISGGEPPLQQALHGTAPIDARIGSLALEHDLNP
jgi:hypothetical protein